MTDEATMLSRLRYRIGDPSPNDVTAITLREFWNSALQRLAHFLKWNIPPATTITVASGDYSLPLPDNLMWLLWVEWNNQRLQPDQINRLILNGVNWATLPAGTLSRYAIQGRQLILLPGPSSDTTITYSYIANSPGLEPKGITGLSEQDVAPALYDAASEFLMMYPGDDDATMKKRSKLLEANLALYKVELANAQERYDNPALFANKSLRVGWRRSYPAR